MCLVRRTTKERGPETEIEDIIEGERGERERNSYKMGRKRAGQEIVSGGLVLSYCQKS